MEEVDGRIGETHVEETKREKSIDIAIVYVGGVNNHDHAFEDVKTLDESVNKGLGTNEGNECTLISKNT